MNDNELTEDRSSPEGLSHLERIITSPEAIAKLRRALLGETHDDEVTDDKASPEEPSELDRIINDKMSMIKRMIKLHIDAGWHWDRDKNSVTHPDDPDMHYWVNSHTQEVVLSAKLVEWVRGELERLRRKGEP